MFKWDANSIRKYRSKKHTKELKIAYNRAILKITANMKNKALIQRDHVIDTEVGYLFFETCTEKPSDEEIKKWMLSIQEHFTKKGFDVSWVTGDWTCQSAVPMSIYLEF